MYHALKFGSRGYFCMFALRAQSPRQNDTFLGKYETEIGKCSREKIAKREEIKIFSKNSASDITFSAFCMIG